MRREKVKNRGYLRPAAASTTSSPSLSELFKRVSEQADATILAEGFLRRRLEVSVMIFDTSMPSSSFSFCRFVFAFETFQYTIEIQTHFSQKKGYLFEPFDDP